MESVSLRRQPVVIVDNLRAGLLLEETDRVYSTILFNGSSFTGHVFAKQTKTIEFPTGMMGRMAVLEVLFERKMLDVTGINVSDFTLDVTKDMISAVALSAKHGYTWRIGVAVACALQQRADWIRGIFTAERETVHDLIRAVCLPYLRDGKLETRFVDDMHSRRWPEGSSRSSDYIDKHFLATRATTAAYIFARENGIPVDDRIGLTYIRQEALVGELASSRRIPWIESGVDAL